MNTHSTISGLKTKRLTFLRDEYHAKIGSQIVRFTSAGPYAYPNFADSDSRSSIVIAKCLSKKLGFKRVVENVDNQSATSLFEIITCSFVADAFTSLRHLRPGNWEFLTAQTAISNLVEYRHLNTLVSLVKTDPNLAAALGHGYIVTPDIVIVRQPVTEDEINHYEALIEVDEPTARLTQFRASNQPESPARSFLHASVSCKWTIRSDRSQNTRTEALNLIRNRKGPLPHIVAVTAEPLPMRIASLALGTGDLDCVYHFALPELRAACATVARSEDQLEILDTMIQGNRLRDISDLPFDLAV